MSVTLNDVPRQSGTAVRLRTVVAAAVLLSAVWLLFWAWIGPALIRSAYAGESVSILNAIIEGRQYGQPVQWYLDRWARLGLHLSAALALAVCVGVIASRPAFFAKFVGVATPGVLGVIRVLTCAALLITTSWEDFSSIALLPDELRRGAGAMGILYGVPGGVEWLLDSPNALRALQYATELFLFLGMIGLLTRLVIPLAAVTHFIALGLLVDYSFYWHQGLVPLYLLTALSFAPCGDGWSVDRLRKVYRGDDVPRHATATYGWWRYVCWVLIALPYVQAGLSKVRLGGLDWWNPTSMRGTIYIDALTPREYHWNVSSWVASAPDALFVALAVTTIVVEVGYVLVLFSSRARHVIPVLAVAMHLGILLLQRILFLDLILLQLTFVNWTRVREAVRRRIAARHRSMVVLYDGSCALCRRTVRLLGAVDLLGALEFTDFRRLDLTEYNRQRSLSLQLANLDRSMHVIARRGVYDGFRAYRAMAATIPLAWPAVPFLWLPGVARLGEVVYSRVAAKRISCDDTCVFEAPVDRPGATINESGRTTRIRFAAALAIVIAVTVGCFLVRFEFYPFTAWHLYAGADMSGKAKYYKVIGHYDSGPATAARLEDGIGAFALDGRYLHVLDKCFGSAVDVEVCNDFLVANGAAYNAKEASRRRLTKYEIQSWTWDFASNPRDPNFGQLVDTHVVEIASLVGGGTSVGNGASDR